MKKYWFIVETYVFLWKKEDHILVYNSISGKGYIYKCSPDLLSFIDQLMLPENLYCSQVDEELLRRKSIGEFVISMQSNFCGSLFDVDEFPQKPIVAVPDVNIGEDIEGVDNSVFGGNVLRNLTDVFICLTGKCNKNCPDCNLIYKQMCWCHKSNESLAFEKLEAILKKLEYLNVFELHFTGGNMFLYPYWRELLIKLNEISYKKSFYVHYSQLRGYDEDIDHILNLENSVIRILVDFADFDVENLLLISKSRGPFEYLFKITSWNEYNEACDIIERLCLNAKIIPFYNVGNYSFFEDNVFLNMQDILSAKWTKNEIFANQKLNTNDFGKIRILENGFVYANLNFAPIGKWHDDYREIIYNELKRGTSWRRTRDSLPVCKECLCKYLCPSPSNYELAIGKSNLCHVKS